MSIHEGTCWRVGCNNHSIPGLKCCPPCQKEYRKLEDFTPFDDWAATTPKQGADEAPNMRDPNAPSSLTSPLWYSWMDPQPKEICQQLGYNLGCVVKYVCRQGLKPDTPALDDLRKAMSYLEAEIKRQQDAQHKALTKGNQ